MAEASIGDTLRVFAQSVDSILQTRFARLEAAVAALEQRVQAIETGIPIPQPPLIHMLPTPTPGVSLAPPAPIVPAPAAAPTPGPTKESSDNEHSWYLITVEHPSSIPDKSPEHLVSLMYKIIESKAIKVAKHTACLKLDSAGKPSLYMLIYVNRNSIQSHFIQRWNGDEKGSVSCRKLKRLEQVIDEFRKLKTSPDTPQLLTYRSQHPGIFVGVRWGTLTQEFIVECGMVGEESDEEESHSTGPPNNVNKN